MPAPFFQVHESCPKTAARTGTLRLAHAEVPTPVFMPVGTAATVKAMTPQEVAAIGYRLILGNTFHLELRPGSELIQRLGGLHQFMNWPHGLLTDSGGYQVFSLAAARKISEQGAVFRSPYDGAECRLTPESAVDIQHRLGADVIMALDECLEYGAPETKMRESMELSLRWLDRCARRHRELIEKKGSGTFFENRDREKGSGDEMESGTFSEIAAPSGKHSGSSSPRSEDMDKDREGEKGSGALSSPAPAPFSPSETNAPNPINLFGIVQGGFSEALRRESSRRTAEFDLPGYAVGGLSVGEPEPEMMAMLEAGLAHLPSDRPRYAMGIGLPLNLIDMVMRGVDMFDCVVPTRNARNGRLYTFSGTLIIKHAENRESPEPVEADCPCDACQNYTRAYLRHLYAANEILYSRLATLHNLTFFYRLMERIREAIPSGRLPALRDELAAFYGETEA